jgi:hypothetical protein
MAALADCCVGRLNFPFPRKIILVALRIFAFSHSQGQPRRFAMSDVMSAIAGFGHWTPETLSAG